MDDLKRFIPAMAESRLISPGFNSCNLETFSEQRLVKNSFVSAYSKKESNAGRK